MSYRERDITRDPEALEELRTLGAMTTPVTVIDGKVIVGFDVVALSAALGE